MCLNLKKKLLPFFSVSINSASKEAWENNALTVEVVQPFFKFPLIPLQRKRGRKIGNIDFYQDTKVSINSASKEAWERLSFYSLYTFQSFH